MAKISPTLDAPQCHMDEVGKRFVGISDITARVDAKLTPVNRATEAFSACQIRCEMLHGQWLAECSRLQELGEKLRTETEEAVKQVTNGGNKPCV